MQEENDLILADLEFRRIFEQRLEDLDYREELDYHCSGEDEKELREFKIKANDKKILFENKKKGLTEILSTFTVGRKIDFFEEPETYYEYLLSQLKM